MKLHAMLRKDSEQVNSGGKIFPRASATGGAWLHAPPPMKAIKQWIENVFFFSVFLLRR